jgi:hypothetical protein
MIVKSYAMSDCQGLGHASLIQLQCIWKPIHQAIQHTEAGRPQTSQQPAVKREQMLAAFQKSGSSNKR